MVAAAEIGIEPGSKHLRQHSDGISAAVHPAHEAGVRIAGRERKHNAHEVAVDRREVGGADRHGLAQATADLVRDRLPDRALADALDIVENIVEHAVPLGTQGRPIRRIQGSLRGQCPTIRNRLDAAPRHFRSSQDPKPREFTKN